MAHGFTQNRQCWGPLAEDLARHHEVLLVDCPGHGESGHDDSSLWEAAELLLDVGETATYLGYSMGGRMALHAALAAPSSVSRLILIGATAGIDDEAERAQRRERDAELAEGLIRGGLPAFLDNWLSLPLFAGLTEQVACRDQRLLNRTEGLAASLRNCGTGAQESLWDRLGELTMPLLVVAGSDDHKFTEIGHRIVTGANNAHVEMAVPTGTHAIHLEQPALVAQTVRDFVARTGGPI